MRHPLSGAAADVRIAFRNLRQAPALAAIAIGTLTVAIAANTAVFSAADAVLLRPLPIANPDRLVVMWETNPGRNQGVGEVSHRNFLDWRSQNQSFESMVAMGSVPWSVVLDHQGHVQRVERAGVSGSFFGLLGVAPLLGRPLTPDDDVRGAPGAAVLGHGLWQQRFGGDPDIVGTSVRLNDRPYTIVGVMPRGFAYPRGADLWTPVVPALDRWTIPGQLDPVEARHYGMLFVIARLRPAVTLEQARAEMDALVRRLPEFPRRMSASEPVVVLTPFLDHVYGQTRRALMLLLCMVGLVLAAACANVSSLLLTRASARRRDTAIKIALGAGRARLFREWLAETAVVASAATAAGLLLGRALLHALVAIAPVSVPQLEESAVNARVAVFSVGVAVLVAMACAAAPALHSSPLALVQRLKETRLGEGREGRRTRRWLMVAQLGIATALLVGAGLLVRSFANVRQLDLGFDAARVLTLDVEPVVDSRQRYRAVYDAILERVALLPGVQAVGAVNIRPLTLGPVGADSGLLLEGQSIDRPESFRNNPWLNFQAVTPGYFTAMAVPLRKGRTFAEQDGENAPPVAIVSEATAQRLWPGEDPIGKRLSIAAGRTAAGEFPKQTVVGVVANVRYRGLADVRFDVYMPAPQTLHRVRHLMVRTRSDAASIVAAVRAAVRTAGGRVVVEHVATMEDVVDQAVAPWRFSMALFVSLAGIGVMLAAIGLFGLVAYSVATRTPELALRLAIGARPSDLMAMLLFETGRVVVAGVILGALAALALTEFLSALLFQVEPRDAATFAAVVTLLGGVAVLATCTAARRATVIDPIVVLRSG